MLTIAPMYFPRVKRLQRLLRQNIRGNKLTDELNSKKDVRAVDRVRA
jgi:hypothetical protein